MKKAIGVLLLLLVGFSTACAGVMYTQMPTNTTIDEDYDRFMLEYDANLQPYIDRIENSSNNYSVCIKEFQDGFNIPLVTRVRMDLYALLIVYKKYGADLDYKRYKDEKESILEEQIKGLKVLDKCMIAIESKTTASKQ